MTQPALTPQEVKTANIHATEAWKHFATADEHQFPAEHAGPTAKRVQGFAEARQELAFAKEAIKDYRQITRNSYALGLYYAPTYEMVAQRRRRMDWFEETAATSRGIMITALEEHGFTIDGDDISYQMTPGDDYPEDEARWELAATIMKPYGYAPSDDGILLDGISTVTIKPL